ncbi:hypothetical protein [Arthrobacter sp. U41]|uniref:hypothetical protein n=2 Tax=Bacillati TaxID=1783272 RepID=UPI0011A44807|nr:hypothetical protein [Arthrobacter sp. U41]
MKIEFSDFGVDDAAVFGFTARDDEKETHLTFALPERFFPDHDLVGIAIATLTGRKYDEIVIDLPMSADAASQVQGLTGASVKAPLRSGNMSRPTGLSYGLNFSGGFDSLAALALLPADTKLVSLDFGGGFAREREFYQQFKPASIATNFRAEGFAENSWSFMGIGTILLRDYLDLGTLSFGAILEASPWNFQRDLIFGGGPQPWFKAAGLNQVNPALGLTEVGTIMLIAENYPSKIRESLTSLANSGSEKLTRKFLLLRIVEDLMGVNLGVPDLPARETPHFAFGRSFATDFLALYVLKKLGSDGVGSLVGKIPDHVKEFVAGRSLDFYERLNPTFYAALPTSIKQRVYAQCLNAGIDAYTEKDWSEFRETTALLSEWHPALKR